MTGCCSKREYSKLKVAISLFKTDTSQVENLIPFKTDELSVRLLLKENNCSHEKPHLEADPFILVY